MAYKYLLVILGLLIINLANAVNFNDYPVKLYTGKKAPLNYKSHFYAKMFKTHINDAYNAKKPDFAGNYSVALWGCGAGCATYAMIDRRTGKVYSLGDLHYNATKKVKLSCEQVPDHSFFITEYHYQADSRLMIAEQLCTINEQEQYIYLHHYLLWNDKAKQFSLIDEKFITKNE